MPRPEANPARSPAASGAAARRATVVLAGVVLVVGAALLAGLGGPHDTLTGALIVIDRMIFAGGPALAYVLAGVGLGRVCTPLVRGASCGLALQAASGIALLLWLSHVLGWAGLLGGGTGRAVAVGVLATGIGLLVYQFVRWLRAGGFEPRLHPLAVPGAAGVAVLLVACANPPGALWDSEFGGYDTLGYHLQLPREWLEAGRLTPLHHNVYSYLPGYLEGAFLHLGAVMAAGPSADAPAMVAGFGHAAHATQYLHAALAVFAGALVGLLGDQLARRAGVGARAAGAGGAFAGAMTLLTPWTVVTGSMAYNDMGAVLLLAAAALAMLDEGLSPVRRGVLAGLLLGAAASVKPTAFLFGVPLLALLGAWCVPARGWARLALGGLAAGACVVAPWLARNAIDSGNPVFPFAAGLFANDAGGTGHWTAEQVSRFAGGHHFDGSLIDRLTLLVSPDPADPAGARHRGALHPQWAWFFPVVIAAGVAGLAMRTTHRSAAVLTLALGAGLLVWLFMTHLQSRFLMPLLVPGGAMLALALGGALHAAGSRAERGASSGAGRSRVVTGALLGVAGLLLAGHAWALVSIFAAQRGGSPNALLAPGTRLRTADGGREELEAAPRDQARAWVESAPPEPFVNAVAPRGARVYLLGTGTALYFRGPLVYNATWDAWPFGEIVAAHPNDPAAWSRALRERGIDLVLVDFGEIARLTRSGWIDPRVRGDEVAAWVRSGTVVVRAWDEVGVFLVMPLTDQPPSGPADTGRPGAVDRETPPPPPGGTGAL
ncbi:MAG: glycosyltransferase 87 family protein [Planctomycetota bacterium]|nr:glycosyltransferase 87 family protein [Planctomycetota bacterium]